MQSAPHAIEIRPSAAAYRVRIWRFVVWALMVLLVRSLFGAPTLALVAIAGLIAIPILAVLLHIRTYRVVLLPDRIERRGTFVPDIVIPLDGVDGLLGLYGKRTGDPSPLLALGQDARPRIRLTGAVWDIRSLVTIARHVGVPEIQTTMGTDGFEERLAGSVPWIYRHPLLFAVAVAAAFVVVVVLCVVIWFSAAEIFR